MDTLQSIQDSLLLLAAAVETNDAYKTYMIPKVYFSTFYDVTKKDRIGILGRAEYFNQAIHPSVTVSYNRMLGRVMSLGVSWSAYERNYANLGLGATLNIWPVQFYMIGDNFFGLFSNTDFVLDGNKIPSMAIFPVHQKYFNLHFGCNLIFGRKPKVNKAKMQYGPDYLFKY